MMTLLLSLSYILLGVTLTSAEIGEPNTPTNSFKLLVKYTNSLGKFSSTPLKRRSINHSFDNENIVDRIASSAKPVSVTGLISQVEVEGGDVEGAIEALLMDDEVADVEMDYPMYKFPSVVDTPNKEKNITAAQLQRKLQDVITYGVQLIQAPDLWSTDRMPTPIKICIVDTGYDKTHVDLPSQGVTSTATNFADAFSDVDGHGTHISGVIGALGNDGGVIGINPNSKTFSFHISKALGDDGRGSASTVISGIEGCLQAGSKVITLSLGGGKKSKIQEALFKQSYDDGVLIFAASGNSGTDKIEYPASYPSVISVAAVGEDGAYAAFSNYNDQVELVGPGVSIKSTLPGNLYGVSSGTSMAAPHVAGAAALVWSYFPDCTNYQIRNVLALTAKSSSSCNSKTGFGLIQAKAAYDLLDEFGCIVGGKFDRPKDVEGGCHPLPAKPVTATPTTTPTTGPSKSPSKTPSASPSFRLFQESLHKPSLSPSEDLQNTTTEYQITETPSVSPSIMPSQVIISTPSQSPSDSSSSNFTKSPTSLRFAYLEPSLTPSKSPSSSPSNPPTNPPSRSPSSSPSVSPLKSPSLSPSASPTTGPTMSPTTEPSISPSNSPSLAPIVDQSKFSLSDSCEDGEVWFGIDFTFDSNTAKIYWFLLDKCSRSIVFDCQNCYTDADPYSTNSFGSCIPDKEYIFYFDDYSGNAWVAPDSGYVLQYHDKEVFNTTGNVGSSEELMIGTQIECPEPPSIAPTSAAPTMPCASGESHLDIHFSLDAKPSGVYWFLIDRCMGPLVHDCQACYMSAQPYSSQHFSRCFPNGHYSFIFHDYSGVEWSPTGGYTINYAGTQVLDNIGGVQHSQEVFLGSKTACPGYTTTPAPQSAAPTSAAPTPFPTLAPMTAPPINYSTGCASDQVRFDVRFDFDADPSKTFWYLVDRCAGTLVHDCQGCYSNSEPGSSKFFYRCLPSSRYSFIFNEYSGARWADGGYVINYNQKQIIDTRGNVEPLNEVKFGQDSCEKTTQQPSTSPISCNRFHLDIATDNKPSEISWSLEQRFGDESNIVGYGPVENQQYEENSVYIEAASECLLPGEYQFTINDTGNDGIDQPGYYKIYLNGVTVREGNNFGSYQSTGFIVPNNVNSNGLFF